MPDIVTLGELLRQRAAAHPDRIAIIIRDERVGYAEINRRANRVANGLSAAGLKAGARIALLDKNDTNYFELQFGCAKAGMVLVPINWRLAPPEIAFIVKDAASEMLFYGPEFAPVIAAIRGELGNIPLVPLGAGGRDGYEAWRDRQSDGELPARSTPDDTVLQLYTSGTTGRAKGVQLNARGLLVSLPGFKNMGVCREDDVYLLAMPFFHIGGSAVAVMAVALGCPSVVVRDIDPKALLDAVATHRVTSSFLVPAVILFMLNVPSVGDTDLSSLRLILYGGSPIPVALLKRAMAVFKCGFGQVYGMTEAHGTITYLGAEDHDPGNTERLKSCGRAIPDVEMKIVDADGNEVPDGTVGEVVCRAVKVMKGYWNRPEENARAIRDGWFHSGDAGYRDQDGYYFIYDRVKDMIVSGGENIYPAEVENALYGHPAIQDVAVIGVPDDTWGETVKACVVLKQGANATADELILFARQRIGGFKLPRSVDFMTEIPRNATGKFLKRALREPYWRDRDRQVN
ncbi:MAG TPA: fatty acid--CoA ligase [Stellaceae bacterium]|jgi:acyl-CoA synthetase (AMP-forming)/AMP-acid ligase II